MTSSLRKHAYSHILKILPSKNENVQIKILIFFMFYSKYRLWVLVTYNSLVDAVDVVDAVVMSTFQLCFEQK